eukprot:239300-Karenia_brevis.AAC.1
MVIQSSPSWFLSQLKKLLHLPIAVLYLVPDDLVVCCPLYDDACVHNSHVCMQCGKMFASLQKLRLHAFRVHAALHPAHLFAAGVHCPCCLTYFHTRTRLLEHLMYKGKGRGCLQMLMLQGPVHTHEEALSIQQDNALANTSLARAGRKRSFAVLPSFRVAGPLRPKLTACLDV